jgi:hypothetical protein
MTGPREGSAIMRARKAPPPRFFAQPRAVTTRLNLKIDQSELFDERATLIRRIATQPAERIAKEAISTEAISNKIVKQGDSNKNELGGGGPQDRSIREPFSFQSER